ncbi:terminase [Reyranella sp.]|uniref:terminase n=1 Tax=Reyranella sp. TaxID=1929291 RepID=UPI0025D9DE9D|nr:terminase [Reyranella sp.]
MSAPVARRRSSDPLTEQARVLASLRHDPLGFVEWAFPWGEPGALATSTGPEPWQRDVLEEIGRGLAAGTGPVRVAVASGHGVGKSALVAWLILWAAITDPATRGVVTANTETQLKTKTWAELGKWHRLAVTGKWNELGATSLVSTLPVEEGAGRIDMVPWSAHNAEAFAGLHNKGSRVLLVFDEASAISDPIWETAEGALTDADTEIVWVVFGNPTRPQGRFFECFNRFRDRWTTQQVDSRQVSLTDKQQLAQWVADYGEDSDFVKVRVRGLFPRAGTLQFIDSDSVAAAMHRVPDTAAERNKPLVMGVDVARFGADRSVIVLRRGRDAHSYPIEKYQGLDTMTLAAKIVERAAAEGVRAVFVDEGGYGAGVVDRLRQLGVPFVFGINFGSKPETWDEGGAKPLYANKRAEIWGNMKAWLAQGCLPADPELMADLTGLQYGYDARSAIQLEKKEDMKKRGLASPDIGDALALTFALPVTGAAWDLTRGQNFYETDYDLCAEFDDDYWYGDGNS